MITKSHKIIYMLIINSICNNLYKFVSMSDIEKEIFEVEEFNEELEQP